MPNNVTERPETVPKNFRQLIIIFTKIIFTSDFARYNDHL